MRKPRVIIVGGGPSGGACALSLARTGRYEVLVLDKSPGTVEGISFALESGITAAECITRHLTTQQGLSPLACAAYRAQTMANVLTKFWLGEGLARGARSPRVRGWAERLLRSQASGWFNRAVSVVLDETRHAA